MLSTEKQNKNMAEHSCILFPLHESLKAEIGTSMIEIEWKALNMCHQIGVCYVFLHVAMIFLLRWRRSPKLCPPINRCYIQTSACSIFSREKHLLDMVFMPFNFFQRVICSGERDDARDERLRAQGLLLDFGSLRLWDGLRELLHFPEIYHFGGRHLSDERFSCFVFCVLERLHLCVFLDFAAVSEDDVLRAGGATAFYTIQDTAWECESEH